MILRQIISGISFFIHKPAKIYNYLYNDFQLRRAGVKHGKHMQINGKLHIHAGSGIEIGDYFMANSGLKYNATSGGGESYIAVGANGRLIIGHHVGISNLYLTASELIEIGDYTMIGSNCMIADTDFHSVDETARKAEIDNWFTPPQKNFLKIYQKAA